MKNDQLEIDKSDINLAFSQKAGAIQRNFGMEVTNFYQQNINAYATLAANYAGQTGTGSTTQGRAAKLAMLRQQAGNATSLKYADIAQTEAINQSNREKLSAMSQAVGQRGVYGHTRTAIARPVGPSKWDQGLAIAQTAIGLATGAGGAYHATTGKQLFA